MLNERGFLKAILERPDDDATKLVYADWLDEQGDPRGEFLRLMVKVRQEQVVTPEQRQRHQDLSAGLVQLHAQQQQAWSANQSPSQESRVRRQRVQELEGQLAELSREIRRQLPARLQELAASFDPDWLAVVSDPEIEGCGKSTPEGLSFRFDFLCEQSWADLVPTGDDRIRHCEACRKNVHFCDTLADAREHSHDGDCIAVDLGIIRREGDLSPKRYFVGRPSRDALQQTYEEGVDPVSQARLNARKQGKK